MKEKEIIRLIDIIKNDENEMKLKEQFLTELIEYIELKRIYKRTKNQEKININKKLIRLKYKIEIKREILKL